MSRQPRRNAFVLTSVRFMKPVVMATFSDASETMLREMYHEMPPHMIPAQRDTECMQLVSMPKFHLMRPLSCYFFDFHARFFNSNCISEAFVDLLRATYVFSSFNCIVICSLFFYADATHRHRCPA